MILTIVIPAFNESKVIGSVLDSVPKKINRVSKVNIVVVDDNSNDKTSEIAQKKSTVVLRHKLNRGAGAATRTGIVWALDNDSDVIATFDADGQHNPGDLEKIIEPIIDGKADLVIGSRFLKKQQVPTDRFLINWIANITTYLIFGIFTTDSQSGLRAFSKKAASKINFRADRMEFSSEILSEAKKHNLKIKEIPTSAIYTQYSRHKGQKNTNVFPIMMRFFVKILR